MSKHKTQITTIRNIPDNQWHELLNHGHHLGSPTAPIKLIEFSDFQCPYCRDLEPTLKGILNKYPSKIEFVFYEFPLSIHPQAQAAAIAAECAARQRDFFAYNDLLFHSQRLFPRKPWTNLAQLAGINDLRSFSRCLKDTSINKLINRDKKFGQKINVQATPTLIINGKMISGVISENRLDQLVQQALKK